MQYSRFDYGEWDEIADRLARHHAIFYQLWCIGEPVFTDKVKTAGIEFDCEGRPMVFHFNPEFWKKLSIDEKLFLICHECLHVVLNHGVRIKDAKQDGKEMIAEIAIDLVVNHMLIRDFGFDRNKIPNLAADGFAGCWVDTVYPPNSGAKDTDFYEKHFNRLDQLIQSQPPPKQGEGQGQQQDGEGDGEGEGQPNPAGNLNGKNCKPYDSHKDLEDNKHTSGRESLKDAAKELTGNQKKQLQQAAEQHYSKPAGTAEGMTWLDLNIGRVRQKRTWEQVIKKWNKRALFQTDQSVEQWQRTSRRYSWMQQMSPDIVLPTDDEVNDKFISKEKIEVWLFLDVSGSCIHWKDRFFAAARSFPKHKFKVRGFTFDTQVREVDINSNQVLGGGGTCFSIIEQRIQQETKGTNGKYPKNVFIITDGWGTPVKPQKPENWFWFMTDTNDGISVLQNYVDTGRTNIFYLEDFEPKEKKEKLKKYDE